MTRYKPTSLLPKSYETELHALDLANAKWIEGIRLEAQKIQTLANPMLCPIEYLPLLAEAFGVDFFWNTLLSEYEQRLLIQRSLLLHSKKGTKWAITQLIDVLSISTEITEWFEYDGEPYHFKVKFYSQKKEITQELRDILFKIVDEYKNVRSVIEEITLGYKVQNSIKINIGGVGQVRQQTQMIEGYSSEALTPIYINIGAVGQTTALATMEG